MKTLLTMFCLGLLFQSAAQTPEQKQQMEEAIRKQDSIMNLPHIKEVIARTKAMEAQMEKDMQDVAPLASSPKNAILPQKNLKAEDEFYWYNTIESDTFYVFKDWSYGAVELRTRLYDRRTKDFVAFPMGMITAEGRVQLELPGMDPDLVPWKSVTINYSEGENMMNKSLEYSDPDAQWISTRFSLEAWKNNTRLGFLKMGNHIKPVVNLNSPCCARKAGDGYAVSWVFMDRPNQVTGQKSFEDGSSEQHDLQFARGWNLIKIEVDGTQYKQDSNIAEWTHKKHSVTPNMPMGVKFYFTKN